MHSQDKPVCSMDGQVCCYITRGKQGECVTANNNAIMPMTTPFRIITVISVYWIVSWEAIFLNKWATCVLLRSNPLDLSTVTWTVDAPFPTSLR